METNKKAEQNKPAETIPVREGEEINQQRLCEYLQDKLEDAEKPMSLRQFPGGHANLTYLLLFGDRQYVLRRPPLGPVAQKSHDMSREYRVLTVLYKAFPPAPQAFLLCEDLSIIGAPFFIMERKEGIVVRRSVPEVFGGGEDAEKNRVLSETLVDCLVDFHNVDYTELGLEGIGHPEGYMQRQINGWADRYERAKTKDIPFIKDLRDWMLDKLPFSKDYVLLHNDWRLDNMMLDPQDPRKVVGVFDWDMCTLGDPLSDLGCLLSLWFEKEEMVSDQKPMPSDLPGFMTRKEAIHRYGEKSGRNVDKIDFYYVFGMYKMAVIIQQIYFRYAKGQTKDKRFELFGVMAEMLLEQAWNYGRASTI